MERDTLLNLLFYGLIRMAIRGIKGVVVAIGASITSKASITVGAGETRINGDFLHPLTEFLAEIVRISVKSSVMAPGEADDYRIT